MNYLPDDELPTYRCYKCRDTGIELVEGDTYADYPAFRTKPAARKIPIVSGRPCNPCRWKDSLRRTTPRQARIQPIED